MKQFQWAPGLLASKYAMSVHFLCAKHQLADT